MTTTLDLTDIQGNIIKPYGRFSFIKSRYFLLKVNDGERGRAFVGSLSHLITSAIAWSDDPDTGVPKPRATTNMAVTFRGLKKLQIPRATLQGFPQEFAMGMKKRKDILGDTGPSSPENWDRVWHQQVHILITINGQTREDVEERYQVIRQLVAASQDGVEILLGHRGENGAEDLPYQDGSAVFENGIPTAKEHFGYRDGIGDPAFCGQQKDPSYVVGRGKRTKEGGWAPLATGEFLLGHVDEAKEYPPAPVPRIFSRNGTFMAYRKLHENVGSYNRFIEEQARDFDGSYELLAAKLAGRWKDNGAPVVNVPDDASKARWDIEYEAADAAKKQKMLTDFTFNEDIDGAKCPLGAHLRRVNPRGSLEFGHKGAFDTPGALVNRRRIMRRGLPYGEVKDRTRDDGNHGIIFMALNVDIERQFEFVLQQWINYGNDFKQANDKEPLLGNHDSKCPGKMTIPAVPGSGNPPHMVQNIPRLVETRGGEYFFIPSLTAIRMIAAGTIDPT